MKQHIRIIAPSSTLPSYEEAQSKLEMVINFLKIHGFEVSAPHNIFANPSIPFNSNIREVRLEHLKDALEDPEIDIIWAFRGGNGGSEIAMLAMKITPINSKILIGFSDITSLHLLFNQHYQIPTIHGPVLSSLLDKHPHMIEVIKEILEKKEQSVRLVPKNQLANNSPKIEGELTGGNLTILCCNIGTALEPHTIGKILILEDVNEPGYRIRRALTQLEQSGKINKLAACILGDFTESDDKIEWAIDDFIVRNPAIPIFSLKGVGHWAENIPLVFGRKATIIDGILKYSLGDN